jgi:hypothetical protein
VWQQVTFFEEHLLEELEMVISPRWRRAENPVKSMERKRKLSWDRALNVACKVERSSGVCKGNPRRSHNHTG